METYIVTSFYKPWNREIKNTLHSKEEVLKWTKYMKASELKTVTVNGEKYQDWLEKNINDVKKDKFTIVRVSFDRFSEKTYCYQLINGEFKIKVNDCLSLQCDSEIKHVFVKSIFKDGILPSVVTKKITIIASGVGTVSLADK